jgi:hypothetical protein
LNEHQKELAYLKEEAGKLSLSNSAQIWERLNEHQKELAYF